MKIRGVILPADGKYHSGLPRNTVDVVGVCYHPDPSKKALILWIKVDESRPAEGDPMSPVIVLDGQCDLPEGAQQIAFLAPDVHVWQVSGEEAERQAAENGEEDKPKVRVYKPGDMHTGPGSPVHNLMTGGLN